MTTIMEKLNINVDEFECLPGWYRASEIPHVAKDIEYFAKPDKLTDDNIILHRVYLRCAAPTPPKSMGMETMFEPEPVTVLCRGAKC